MSVYMECPYMEYQSLAVFISLQKSFFRSIIDMYLTWLNSINKLATRGHHSQKKIQFEPTVQTARPKASNSENFRILASKLAILAVSRTGTQLIPMYRTCSFGCQFCLHWKLVSWLRGACRTEKSTAYRVDFDCGALWWPVCNTLHSCGDSYPFAAVCSPQRLVKFSELANVVNRATSLSPTHRFNVGGYSST